MLGRRPLLPGCLAAALAAPPALHAQALPGRARVGFLAPVGLAVDNFRRWTVPELAREGLIEGRNLEIVARSSEGNEERLRAMAAEILAARPDVVVASSNPAAYALRAVEPAVPIVMGFAGDDPVAGGLAQSLARPGGTVTGVVILAADLALKRLELAREALPRARRIGYLAPPVPPARVAAIEAAARSLGAEPVLVHAAGPEDFDAAFAALRAGGAEALVLGSAPALAAAAAELAARALEARLPAVCEWRGAPGSGCLFSYGYDRPALFRRVAGFVLRVLRGEAPGAIPMERADRFELVVDLRTARALGVELPPLLLARADEVVE
jgi:putative tryptophan/tyrosine transport system substrate-binding protein